MKKRSPLLHQLCDSLVLPDYIHAYLDIYTGLIRLNCEGKMLPNLVDHIPQSHLLMHGALFHELQHFMQFSFLGYLYQHATNLSLIIDASFPQEFTSYNDLPRTVKDEEMLYSIQRDIHRALESKISVRSITESLTYHTQKTSMHDNYGMSEHLDHLEDISVDPHCKDAFLYAMNYLNFDPNLYRLYPIISHLSLCSYDPPQTFLTLLEFVKRGKLNTQTYLPQWIDTCKEIDKKFIGFAPNGIRNVFNVVLPTHDVYGKSWSWARNKPDYFSSYLLKPSFGFTYDFLKSACVPILCNPQIDPEEPNYRAWPYMFYGSESPKDKDSLFSSVVLKAVTAQRVFGNQTFGEDQWHINSLEHKKNVVDISHKFKAFNYLAFPLGNFNLSIPLSAPNELTLVGIATEVADFLASSEMQLNSILSSDPNEKSLAYSISKHPSGFIIVAWLIIEGQTILDHQAYVAFITKKNREFDEKALDFFKKQIDIPSSYRMIAASVKPVVGCYCFNEAILNDERVHSINQLIAVAVFEYLGVDLNIGNDQSSIYSFET